MLSLGVPNSWTIKSSCWISEAPGRRGLWARSSAKMQPTALHEENRHLFMKNNTPLGSCYRCFWDINVSLNRCVTKDRWHGRRSTTYDFKAKDNRFFVVQPLLTLMCHSSQKWSFLFNWKVCLLSKMLQFFPPSAEPLSLSYWPCLHSLSAWWPYIYIVVLESLWTLYNFLYFCINITQKIIKFSHKLWKLTKRTQSNN